MPSAVHVGLERRIGQFQHLDVDEALRIAAMYEEEAAACDPMDHGALVELVNKTQDWWQAAKVLEAMEKIHAV